MTSLRQRLKRALQSSDADSGAGRQMDAGFYDHAFRTIEGYHRHYTQSEYYFIWTVIVDRIRHSGLRSILEIGCGPGQLAAAIRDAVPGLGYCGFDFSAEAVALARRQVPGLRFEVADALATDLYRTVAYDLVLSTEFLEHVQPDLDVMRSPRPGARFIGTVPNFPYVSHVRHFAGVEDVRARYGAVFEPDLDVCALPANPLGKTFFLLQGTLKGTRAEPARAT